MTEDRPQTCPRRDAAPSTPRASVAFVAGTTVLSATALATMLLDVAPVTKAAGIAIGLALLGVSLRLDR